MIHLDILNFKIILFSFFVLTSQAQHSTYEGHIYLRNQTDVDSFIKTYGNCHKVNGNLSIYGNTITSIEQLNLIDTVTGFLEIRSTKLESFVGLEGLKYCNMLTIGQNRSLTNIQSLSKMKGFNRLIIEGNRSLGSLDGLVIPGELNSLNINYNNALKNIDVFTSLKSINGICTIRGNDALLNLSGFSNLAQINGGFQISNNNSMVDFNGLNQLTMVDNYLYILNNEALISLDGLNSLKYIGGELKIVSNRSIEDISRISSADLESSYIRIENNLNLKLCNFENICQYIDSGTLKVSSNSGQCEDLDKLEASCDR